MSSLRTASLVMTVLALAFFAALGSSRVASADTPEQAFGVIIIHKHCDPADSVGTFDGLIDFEFDPAGLPGPTTIDADTEFDIPFQITCGDGSSNTADGDIVEVDIATAMGDLSTWLIDQGPAVVTSAAFEIREFDLPDGVTATYEGCNFDLYAGTITLGLVCVITNTFEEPDDDGNGDGAGDDPDCPACGCCGFDLDLDIDIDNDNTNDIDIDNDNANNNANDNANANDNENDNENENDNVNENTQDQTNNQDQNNTNDQTNNIDSSPEVNISGSLKKPDAKPAPSPAAGGASITPPSTGDAGLSRGDGAAEAVGVVLMMVVVAGLGIAGLRAAGRQN